MFSFLRYISPLGAVRDLRAFLARRQPYELGFLALSMVITLGLLVAFVHDSHVAAPYKPDIIYVEQWRADRTDAEIIAQQKLDKIKQDAELADYHRRQAERQAQFKRLDDHLKSMGI